MAIQSNVLGNNIREYRSMIGMTQEDLSKRVGITPKYLSRLESGQRTPSLDVLFLISKELHVTMDLLVSEQRQDWPPAAEMLYMKLFADCSKSEYSFLIGLLNYTKTQLRKSST